MRRSTGTFEVPCYLVACGPTRRPGFHYSSYQARRAADADPRQRRDGAVRVHRPEHRRRPLTPARISLYGHGLLGSHTEVTATAWRTWRASTTSSSARPTGGAWPRATTVNDAAALGNLNLFASGRRPPPAGRAQHAVPGPADAQPAGLCRPTPAFQAGGQPRDRHLEPVLRRQQPGRDHGRHDDRGRRRTSAAPCSASPAWTTATCCSSAARTSRRSARSSAPAYPDQSTAPVLLDLCSSCGTAASRTATPQYMTSHPLPDTPSHQVLMQIAYGDYPGEHVRRRGRGADDRRLGATSRRST